MTFDARHRDRRAVLPSPTSRRLREPDQRGRPLAPARGAGVRRRDEGLDRHDLARRRVTLATCRAAPAPSAGPDPILLVLDRTATSSPTPSVRLEAAADNAAATEPTVAPAGFATVHARRPRPTACSRRRSSLPTASRVGLLPGGALRAARRSSSLRASPGRSAAAGLIVMLIGVVALALGGSGQPAARCAGWPPTPPSITHASPGRRIAYDGPPDELGSLGRTRSTRCSTASSAPTPTSAVSSPTRATSCALPSRSCAATSSCCAAASCARDDAAESLAMIEAESSRMTRLLDELLSLARLEGASHEFQPLDVRTMLDEGAARARKLGDRRHSPSTCPSGAWINGDPDLLDQALVNVLRNAVAHTRDGGHITLSCSATPATGHRCRVTDDGPGIPQADLDRIFDRFYRAQAARARRQRGRRTRAGDREAGSSTCTAARCRPRTSRRPARASPSRCRGSSPQPGRSARVRVRSDDPSSDRLRPRSTRTSPSRFVKSLRVEVLEQRDRVLAAHAERVAQLGRRRSLRALDADTRSQPLARPRMAPAEKCSSLVTRTTRPSPASRPRTLRATPTSAPVAAASSATDGRLEPGVVQQREQSLRRRSARRPAR